MIVSADLAARPSPPGPASGCNEVKGTPPVAPAPAGQKGGARPDPRRHGTGRRRSARSRRTSHARARPLRRRRELAGSYSDLASAGFGGAWGQTRTWVSTSRPAYSAGSDLGNGWTDAARPRLASAPGSCPRPARGGHPRVLLLRRRRQPGLGRQLRLLHPALLRPDAPELRRGGRPVRRSPTPRATCSASAASGRAWPDARPRVRFSSAHRPGRASCHRGRQLGRGGACPRHPAGHRHRGRRT